MSYPMENSTPVVHQPTPMQEPAFEREWTTGLCACLEDLPTCCLVFFCPHCYMCYIYRKEGESCWLPVFGAGILPLRIKHRIMHRIMGTLLKDFCISCFCAPLVVCQLKRDLDNIRSNRIDV
ncbi:unnamed protein product [Trichobilharzia szidati]|nr:unnamed protein product [Trichobilharzia szidati]